MHQGPKLPDDASWLEGENQSPDDLEDQSDPHTTEEQERWHRAGALSPDDHEADLGKD